jgi:integrase
LGLGFPRLGPEVDLMARGHVTQRGDSGSWAVFYERPRSADGKRRQTSKSGFATKREAEEFLTAKLREIDAGEHLEPSAATVEQFLTGEWLPSLTTRGLKLTTIDSYRMIVRTRIVPQIGQARLQKLSAAQIDVMYGALLKRGLSARSVRLTHTTLRKALKDGVRWGLLTRNPTDQAEPPAAKLAKADARRARNTWTGDQLRRFLDSTAGDRDAAAWVLLATTGMRRGELLGLRWQDIDLDGKRARIEQTLVRVGRRTEVQTPKTEGSARTVPLVPQAVEALRAHRARQAQEQLLAGRNYLDSGLVFRREDGTPVRPNAFTKRFEHRITQAGLPRIRLHDLRHSFATLALRAGEHPKLVQEILGHASVSITLDIYSHPDEDLLEQSAGRVAALVFG